MKIEVCLMKILVLGNGFDLDHDLPTSYMDFLNFCNYILEMDNPDSSSIKKLKPSQIEYTEILKLSKPVKDAFLTFLRNNHLLNYFNSKLSKQGEHWIDFESEIKYIVNEFKNIEFKLKQSNQNDYVTGANHKIHQILKDLGLSCMDRDTWDEISLSAIHKDLCISLNRFAIALEYYIHVFINNTPITGVSPDIIDFNANKVLSFNYSNTYERVYTGVHWDESIDHVHGVALGNLAEEPNIILGITSNEELLQSYYVEFEKYFQRITKRTGNDYKKWLQPRPRIKQKVEVMFFGHSLDFTDSDIILDLIDHENSTIKIYYYDEDSHQRIVSNLISIIGKEKLIKSVSGANPKIILKNQQKHRIDNTAGIEITRDIHSLYSLYELSNIDIEKLLIKIQQKIELKDLSYFYSQEKAINLFEATKYNSIDFTKKEDFIGICESIDFEKDKNGKLVIYNEHDWYDHSPWGDEIECNKETSLLINEINKANMKRFQKEESAKSYAKILTLETSEEMKDELIEIFKEENPTVEYWKMLEELIPLIYKNKTFEKALAMIEKESLSIAIRSKYAHFYSNYETYCFNISYAEQMAEYNQNDIAD